MAEEIKEQPSQPAARQEKDKKSRTALWFGILMITCIILLAGAGFYLLQQLREQQDQLSNQDELKIIEITKQMNTYQSQLATIQTQLTTFDAEISGKETHLNKKLDDFAKAHGEKLETTRAELLQEIKYLQRQLGKTRGDWLVADAEYLLSVANQRLYLVGDLNTTREALEAADQRLRESGDSSVFKVREQIAKELEALQKVQLPDIVGMYATLQSLKEKIPSLAVFLPYAGKEITDTSTIHDHKMPTEESHDMLSTIFGQLEGYVTLRHTDQPIKEILTPEQAQFTRDQLGVKLEMIKTALVQQNEAMYRTVIADAKEWLADNFSQNDDSKRFSAELDRLNAVKFRDQLPDISVSLKRLRDLSKFRIENDKAILDNENQPGQAKPAQ